MAKPLFADIGTKQILCLWSAADAGFFITLTSGSCVIVVVDGLLLIFDMGLRVIDLFGCDPAGFFVSLDIGLRKMYVAEVASVEHFLQNFFVIHTSLPRKD